MRADMPSQAALPQLGLERALGLVLVRARGNYQITPLNRALVHKVFRSEFGHALGILANICCRNRPDAPREQIP